MFALGNNEPMRRPLLVALVVLTVMLGTVVVASGILLRPLPAESQAALQPPPLAFGEHPRGETTRSPIAKGEREYGVYAPPAHEQDPKRHPNFEPPAPILPDTPGGVADVEVPENLSGTFATDKRSLKAPSSQRVVRIAVEVEKGLPVSVDEFGDFVLDTLNDERGWGADGSVSFARTSDSADIRVRLASPGTVDNLCAPLATNGKWSCGSSGRAMINADRWINNGPGHLEVDGDLLTYRTYLINHEIGHLLGEQHEDCPGPGEVAPVMVQQSISTQGCTPNGHPFP